MNKKDIAKQIMRDKYWILGILQGLSALAFIVGCFIWLETQQPYAWKLSLVGFIAFLICVILWMQIHKLIMQGIEEEQRLTKKYTRKVTTKGRELPCSDDIKNN